MSIHKHRAAVSVALSLCLLLLVIGAVMMWSFDMRAAAEQRIAAIEPRYARVLGLHQAADQLQEARALQRAAAERLAYPSSLALSQVGNELQQAVRTVVEVAGMSVSSSQVRPPVAEQGFERVSVSLRLYGTLSGLQAALAALQASQPRLIVERLSIHANNSADPTVSPRLNCRLTVAALRQVS